MKEPSLQVWLQQSRETDANVRVLKTTVVTILVIRVCGADYGNGIDEMCAQEFWNSGGLVKLSDLVERHDASKILNTLHLLPSDALREP